MQISTCCPITTVYIYAGHQMPTKSAAQVQVKGPYAMSVDKHTFMFEKVNEVCNKQWKILKIYGHEIIRTLSEAILDTTLLVIPAGESSELDEVFSLNEINTIQEAVKKGLRLYATCGSAYWAARKRIWNDRCVIQPETRNEIAKTGKINLFEGIAIGPLSPYPGQTYSTAFFHEAIEIQDLHQQKITVLLSGGGTFFLADQSAQTVKTLAFYSPSELQKHGKGEEWAKAVISCGYGQGKAILSMLHPGYGAEDIDVQAYNQAFPERKDDWQNIRDSLSPTVKRIEFVARILEDLESAL